MNCTSVFEGYKCKLELEHEGLHHNGNNWWDNMDVFPSTNPMQWKIDSRPTPHCCPVCEGRGIVPAGFYAVPKQQPSYTSTSSGPETCRSCSGKGIVYHE